MRDLYLLPELYDEQYERYRDDVGFYSTLVDDYGGPVLELGAGTGRLTSALARSGRQVVGIEPSAPMRLRGVARLQREGLTERVELLDGDMRTIELGRTFPLVIAPFNTLMHAYTLADQDATLASVERHLAPGGAFAFDLFTPRFGPLGVLRREQEWAGVGGERSELFVLQHHRPDSQTIESRYYLDTVAGDGSLSRKTAVLSQRYYTRFEIERALRQAGFGSLVLFGDFSRIPYTHQAPLLVGVARR